MEAAERLSAADLSLDSIDDRQSNSAPPTSRRHKDSFGGGGGTDGDDGEPDAALAAAMQALREKALEQERIITELRSSLAAESHALAESRQSEAHLRLHLTQAHAATATASETAAKQSAAWSSKLSALLQTLRAREAAETSERETEREKQRKDWDAERAAIQVQLVAAQDATRKTEAQRLAASEAHAMQLQSLRSENAALASSHATQLAQVHSHIQSVQADLAISGAQISALHSELERSRSAIAALENEKRLRLAAETDKRDLQMALETARTDLAQLQAATRQERAQLDQIAQREQQKQHEKLEAAHAELDRFKYASQAEHDRLTEQLAETQAQLAQQQQCAQEERQQMQRSNQMDQQWFREQLAEAQARANIVQEQLQQQQSQQPQQQMQQQQQRRPDPQPQPSSTAVASAPLSPLSPRSQPRSAPMSPLQSQAQPAVVQLQQYSLPASPPAASVAQPEPPRQQQQPSPTLQEDPLAQLGQRRRASAAKTISPERSSVSFADVSAPAHMESDSASAASAAAPLAVAAASIPASAVPSSSSATASLSSDPPPSAYVLAAQKRASFAVQEFELSIADIIMDLPLDANANANVSNAAAASASASASASAAAVASANAATAAAASVPAVAATSQSQSQPSAPPASISPHLLAAPAAQPSYQNRRISMKILEASVVSNDEVVVDSGPAPGGRSSKSPKPHHKKAQTRQLSKSSIPGVSELAAESAQLAQQQRREDAQQAHHAHARAHAEEDSSGEEEELQVELVGEEDEQQMQMEEVDETESKQMEQAGSSSVTVHRVSPTVTVHTDPSSGAAAALPAATSAFIPLALFQRLHLKYVGLASTHAALASVQQRNALDLEVSEAQLAELRRLLQEERDRTEAARQTRLDSPALGPASIPIDQECPHCLENALLLDETREASEAKTAEINAVYSELLAIKDAQITENQAELQQLREQIANNQTELQQTHDQISESLAELQGMREEISMRESTEQDLKAALADVEAQGSLSDNVLRSGLKLALRNLSDLRGAHATLRGQFQQLLEAHAESVEGIVHRMGLRGGPESAYDMLSLSSASSMSSTAAAATAAANLWAQRYKAEQRARREACSALQQARGNLRVIARIRPILPSDQSARAAFASEDDKQLLALVSPPLTEEDGEAEGDSVSAEFASATTRNFEFDRVYPSSSSTAELYAAELASMSSALFATHPSHSLVLAVGGPASGKSRSMYGEKALWDAAKASMAPTVDPGIAQRMLSDVFKAAADRLASGTASTKVSLTVFAIGQERITDLLAVEVPRVGSSPVPATVIKIRERPTDGSSSSKDSKDLLFEPALTEVVCSSLDDALAVLKKADKARAVHATQMGTRVSSRHFIVQIKVESSKPASAAAAGSSPSSPSKAKGAVTSTLSLVEFLTRYPSQVPPPSDPVAAKAMRARDAKAGNPALSSLARVFGAIASGAAFVPWRDSTLTRVLQACFERPRGRALCIVHVAPSAKDAGDSLEYLRLGIKARRVIGVNAAPALNKRKLVAAADSASAAATMESSGAVSAEIVAAAAVAPSPEPAIDLFEQTVVDLAASTAAAGFEDDDEAAESFAATLGSTASFERMMSLAKKADEEESSNAASSARPASSPSRNGFSAANGGTGSASKKQGKLPGVALKELQSKLDEALAREEALRKALAVEKGNNALMKAQRRSKSGSTTPAVSANAKDGPTTPLSASALKDAGLDAPEASPSSSSSKRTPSHSRQGSDSGSVTGSCISAGTASARAALVSPPRSIKRSSSTSSALMSPSDRFSLSSASASALSAAASSTPTAEQQLKSARDDISTLKDLIASLEKRLLQKSRMEEDLRSERARFSEKEKEWLVKESRFQEKELRRSRLEAAARASWDRERRTLEAVIAGDPTARAEREMDANLFVNTLAEQPRDVRNPESVCITRLIGDVRELQHHLRTQKQLAANTERFLEAQGLPSMETLWTDRIALAPQFTSVKHYSSSASSSAAASAPATALSSPSSDSQGHQRGYSSPPRIRSSEERSVSFEDELPLLRPGSRTPSPQRRADFNSPPPPSAMTPSHAKSASASLPSSLKPATPAAPTFVIQTTPIVIQRKARPAVTVEQSTAADVTVLSEVASAAPMDSTVAVSVAAPASASSSSDASLAHADGPGSPTSANISRGLEMASMILGTQRDKSLSNGMNGATDDENDDSQTPAAKFINEPAVAAALAELKSSANSSAADAIDHVILSVVPASAFDLANCPGGCLSTRKVVVLSQGSGVLSAAWIAQQHLDPELTLFVVMRLRMPVHEGSEEMVSRFVVVEWIGAESHLASATIAPVSASSATATAAAAAEPVEFAPLMHAFIAAHLHVSLTSQASHPSQVTLAQISSDLAEALQSRGRHHSSSSSSLSASSSSVGAAEQSDEEDGNESDSSTGSFVDLNAQLAEEQQQQKQAALASPDSSASSPAVAAAPNPLDSSFTAADIVTAESVEADLAAAGRARAAAASLANHAAVSSSSNSSYGAALAAVSHSTPRKGSSSAASSIPVLASKKAAEPSAAASVSPAPTSGLRPRKPITPWLSTAARQARAASEAAAAATLEATYTAASFSQTAPASSLAAAMRMPVKSALKGSSSSSSAASAATLAPRTPSPEVQQPPQQPPQPAHKKSVSFVEGDIESENLGEY